MGDEARSDRIERNVPDQMSKVEVMLNELILERPLEDVSDASMSLVPVRTVLSFQLLHGRRQIAAAVTHGKMKVILDEAEVEAFQVVFLHDFGEKEREHPVVTLVQEDLHAPGSARKDVTEETRILDAKWSRHAGPDFTNHASKNAQIFRRISEVCLEKYAVSAEPHVNQRFTNCTPHVCEKGSDPGLTPSSIDLGVMRD